MRWKRGEIDRLTENGRAEDDASDDLSDHLRLTNEGEQFGQNLANDQGDEHLHEKHAQRRLVRVFEQMNHRRAVDAIEINLNPHDDKQPTDLFDETKIFAIKEEEEEES